MSFPPLHSSPPTPAPSRDQCGGMILGNDITTSSVLAPSWDVFDEECKRIHGSFQAQVLISLISPNVCHLRMLVVLVLLETVFYG